MSDKEKNLFSEEVAENSQDTDEDMEALEASAKRAAYRSAQKDQEKKGGAAKEIFEWAQSIAVAMVLALIINQFFFSLVQVKGTSMQPTLESGERLIVTKLFYEPKAGDIVVVKSHQLGKHIIKRVIATSGDVIDINPQTGQVSVNGKELDEPYIMGDFTDPRQLNQYPLTIPEGQVFVMGDNRAVSDDSRTLGPISTDDVVGKASLRIMPVAKFGGLQ